MRSYLAVLTLGLLAACNDGGTNHLADAAGGSDAAQGDAAPTDSAVDAAPRPVTLTVTVDGAPASAVKVYFLAADSTVVANAMTGSDGAASAVMAAGGSVTAIEPDVPQVAFGVTLTSRKVDTFAGVKPGDDLHLDLGNVITQPTRITFDVTIPANGLAVHYELQTPCGFADVTPPVTLRRPGHAARPFGVLPANPPVSVTLSDCGSTTDIMVVAEDVNFTPIATLYAPAQAVADAVPLTIAGTYTDLGTTTIALTNVAATIGDISLEEELVAPHGFVFNGFASISVDRVAGDLGTTASLLYPPAASTTGTTEVMFVGGSPSGAQFDRLDIVDWGTPTDTYALDASTVALADYSTSPVLDTTTQQITWTPALTGLAPDAVTASVEITRTTATTQDDWQWTIAAPGSETGAIQYPTLPTDVFDFAVNDTDSVFISEVDTAKIPGGYDAIRAHAFNFNPSQLSIPGTSGRVAVTSLNNVGLIRRGTRPVPAGWHTKHAPASVYTRRK